MEVGPLTQALARLGAGDQAALPDLVRLLYQDLHAIARRQLRHERKEHTLGPTALVNEAYLKLSRDARIDADSRTRFLGAAAVAMRRVLVDYARTRKRQKRGGGQALEPLDEGAVAAAMSEREADEILALEEALDRLEAAEARTSHVVLLRFYAGLTNEEIAQSLDVSAKTVQRLWAAGRAWLRKEVGRDLGSPP